MPVAIFSWILCLVSFIVFIREREEKLPVDSPQATALSMSIFKRVPRSEIRGEGLKSAHVTDGHVLIPREGIPWIFSRERSREVRKLRRLPRPFALRATLLEREIGRARAQVPFTRLLRVERADDLADSLACSLARLASGHKRGRPLRCSACGGANLSVI